MIQIESAKEPFTTAALAYQAIMALTRADSMGLLPPGERIQTLDLASLRRAVRHIHRAGIARTMNLRLQDDMVRQHAALERALEHLNMALEESPAPEFEWNRLADVLGIDLLSRLLGISASSVHRYRASTRTTPDDVAARVHFLSLVAGDLSGAYNDIGIRQWFDRKRAQLGGHAPAELLSSLWSPRQPGPSQVRELARSLTASPAT